MNLQALLRALELKQTTLAQEALARPAGHESFEYGRVVGIYAGLELAKEILISTVRDAEEKTFNL